jgi:AcrR family transcriptional regulator
VKPNKKRLTAVERRAQLMEVGRSVFAAQGYEASIDDIALKAGVTKPIIYEHFGAKEGLYAAIVDRELDELVERVSKSISRGTARRRFGGAVLAFMTYTKEQPAGFAVLTREAPSSQGRRGLTRVIDDLAERVDDLFRSEFKRAGYDPKLSPIYANALHGHAGRAVVGELRSPRRGRDRGVARVVAGVAGPAPPAAAAQAHAPVALTTRRAGGKRAPWLRPKTRRECWGRRRSRPGCCAGPSTWRWC